jgi:hypothetical protein
MCPSEAGPKRSFKEWRNSIPPSQLRENIKTSQLRETYELVLDMLLLEDKKE